MKLPNSVVHLNKTLHWPEDLLFLGDWCWSDKKEVEFFNLVLSCFKYLEKERDVRCILKSLGAKLAQQAPYGTVPRLQS